MTTYIEKLRAQFEKVTQKTDLPPDVVAMSDLLKLLNSVKYYAGQGCVTQPFEHFSAPIVDAISRIVDGRLKRILDGLECSEDGSKS